MEARGSSCADSHLSAPDIIAALEQATQGGETRAEIAASPDPALLPPGNLNGIRIFAFLRIIAERPRNNNGI